MPTPWCATVKDTASESKTGRLVAVCLLGFVACALLAAVPVHAQAPAPTRQSIYDCIDASGKRIRSDRPILDCRDKDQRLLNPDGSINKVVPPTPTADERADMEARERQEAIDKAARGDAIRRDRNLLSRFPSEAEHNKARAKALDDIRKSVRVSEERVSLLMAERKPILDEIEFYQNKQLPSKLKLSLDANDASLEAQKSLIQNQQSEVVRINALYDVELARLRKLWAGAPAGSLGPLLVTPGAPAKATDSR
jgi:hypothetical protein